MGFLGIATRLLDAPVRRVQISVQRVVLRGEFRVCVSRGTLRLGSCFGEFRQPALKFSLGRLGGMTLLFEREIRLRKAQLQLVLRIAEPPALFLREPRDLGVFGFRHGELVLQLIAQLRELEILLVRGPLRLLQRAERRRETRVDFVTLGGERNMLRVCLVARLLQRGQHLGELAIQSRARLRVRRVVGLRSLARVRERALRRGEALLQIVRGRTQRPFLLARAPRGIRHRLVKIRHTALDLRAFLQKRRALVVRRTRRFGERLLARCDLGIRGREFLADLFEFRRDRAFRLLVPRLKIRKLRGVRRALIGELRFELPTVQLGLRKFSLCLRNLGYERFARAVERTCELLVMRTRVGELRGDLVPVATHGITLGGERRGLRLCGSLEFGKRIGHALKLRVRGLALVRRAIEPLV